MSRPLLTLTDNLEGFEQLAVFDRNRGAKRNVSSTFLRGCQFSHSHIRKDDMFARYSHCLMVLQSSSKLYRVYHLLGYRGQSANWAFYRRKSECGTRIEI